MRPIILATRQIENEGSSIYVDIPLILLETVMLDFHGDAPGDGIAEIRGDGYERLMELPGRLFDRFYPPLKIDGHQWTRLEIVLRDFPVGLIITVYIF